MLKKITTSPYLNFISGFFLLFTACYETWERIGDFSIGVHHGILVFSIVHIIKTIPEVLHGFKEIDEANNEMNEKIST
ncbi:hypothetical protein [Desulfoluna sp.]|uniref:hypothetical protein n=1 Tax=Desulfoluna sp. TaxID=2045199 RepID=UPI00261E3DD2|nr:hypothetical protein [Desulfoluna sp.]